MRFLVLGASVAALTFAAPALANDGAYAGLGLTHDNVASGGDIEGVGFNGIGGSVFVGYDLPLSEGTFAGVELNFDLATAKAGDSDAGVEADNVYGATARLGVNVNDSTALYLRGGYQRGRASVLDSGERYSSSRDGLRLGVGVETSVGGSTRLRVEYNRTHFSSSDADQALLEPLNGGINNDQFVLGFTFGF